MIFFQGIEVSNVTYQRYYVGVTMVCRIFVDVMWENLLRVTGNHFDYNQPTVHYMFTGVSYSH